MKPKLNIYKDSNELFVKFADYVAKLIENSEEEQFHIALSGGSTPKRYFETMVSNYKEKIDWNKVHLWWGDERCVPPDDSESNYGMTKEYLIDHINIPEANVHRIMGENDQADESVRYAKLIDEFVALKNNMPAFDLMLLGMGEDGHTASIFPDQVELFDVDELCAPAVNPYSKQKRVSMTGKLINNSKEIVILLSGEGKSKIVNDILNNDADKKYPVSHIEPKFGNYTWFLDKDAASLI